MAAAPNPIAAENALPGNDPSTWLPPVYTATSIQGYASEESVVPGEDVHLHVQTNDGYRYRVEVYRLGWYGGAGARLLTCVPSCSGDEPGRTFGRPEVNPVTGVVSAGWPVTDTISVPTTWISGYYYALLRVTDGGSDTGVRGYVVFIVRDPPTRRSQILVEVPVNTWQAYNEWGGKSLYPFNSTDLQPAVRVSFDRPLTFTAQNAFDWEVNLVRWLEHQGYDVSYQTDLDTDANPDSLLDHRLVIVAGHDEYWTKPIRDAFDAARDAGTNLAFTGSNAGYWQVRYEDGGRTIVGYKDAAPDPEPDPALKTIRFRLLTPPRPECALEGVMYYRIREHIGPPTDYTVTEAASTDPWFAGTGFKPGDKVLDVGGSEWDSLPEQPEPGCNQPGLVDLLHYQGDPQNGDAVRYTAPSGARIFAAGAQQWSWSLDPLLRSGGAGRVGTVVSDALARRGREEAQMIGVSVLAAALAVAAPRWSTPVQISTGDRAFGPELAMNAVGDALVAWDEEVGAICPTMPANPSCIHIVELAERPTRESPWRAPIELMRPGIGSRPRPAVDANGDAAVIWVHDIGVPRVLQATVRRGPNGEWPNPNDLSNYALGITNHEIVLTEDGSAYATWAERTDSGVIARYERRSDGVWGAATKLDDNVIGGPALIVGRFANQAETVWAEDAGVIEDTLPWDSRVAFGATPRGDPAIASKAGSIAVVFATGSAVAGALCCTLGFSVPTLIGTGADPKVAMNGPSTVAVWLGVTGVQAAEGFVDNATWSPPATLSHDASASDPHVAVDPNGNAVAVWLGGNGTVQAAIRPAATRLWQPAATVSDTGASSPRVAIDAAGNVLAVWNQASRDRIVVESSELFASGPILQRLHVPARGRVHRRIAVSVQPAPWGTPLSGLPLWRFGDGKSATGASVTHVYARPGRYTVTITQADAAGGTATATSQITIVRRARRA